MDGSTYPMQFFESPYYFITQIATDYYFTCMCAATQTTDYFALLPHPAPCLLPCLCCEAGPARQTARTITAAGGTTYMYLFSHRPEEPLFPPCEGVCHTGTRARRFF